MSRVPYNFYHMMLGLPAEADTPDHYELLGLQRFEDDVERIRTAAIDRNRQLLSWQNSQFHLDANRLIGEVVAVRAVLLDPQRKAAYDRQLGRSLGAASVEPPTPPPRPAAGLPPAQPVTISQAAEPQAFPEEKTSAGLAVLWKLKRLTRQLVIESPAWAAIDRRWRLTGGASLIGVILIGCWMFFAARPASLVAPFTDMEARAAQQAWAIALGKASPGERNSIGMELILIPPGKFMMSDSGQVQVTLTQPFYLSKTEVTQGQWQAVMHTTPWKGQSNSQEDANCPATFVSWDDAQEFCKRLGERESVMYRLPTEAEWEYACRAGTTTIYHFGDSESELGNYGWYQGNCLDVGESYAHPVGLKKSNPFGLYDMHGNVWEWCTDWYDAKLSGGRDPAGNSGGMHRVGRGGGWLLSSARCRSANRGMDPPASRDNKLGFRPLAVLSR